MSLHDKQLLMALLAPRRNVTASLNTFGGELLCLYTEFPPYYRCLQSCHCTGTADLLTLISLSVHISHPSVSKENFSLGQFQSKAPHSLSGRTRHVLLEIHAQPG